MWKCYFQRHTEKVKDAEKWKEIKTRKIEVTTCVKIHVIQEDIHPHTHTQTLKSCTSQKTQNLSVVLNKAFYIEISKIQLPKSIKFLKFTEDNPNTITLHTISRPLLINPPICITYYVLGIVISDTEHTKPQKLIPLVQQEHSEKL